MRVWRMSWWRTKSTKSFIVSQYRVSSDRLEKAHGPTGTWIQSTLLIRSCWDIAFEFVGLSPNWRQVLNSSSACSKLLRNQAAHLCMACIPNRNFYVTDWCKEMSFYTRGVRRLVHDVFLTLWRRFLMSFSVKRFNVDVIDRSWTEHFLTENVYVLAQKR